MYILHVNNGDNIGEHGVEGGRQRWVVRVAQQRGIGPELCAWTARECRKIEFKVRKIQLEFENFEQFNLKVEKFEQFNLRAQEFRKN